MRRWWRWGLALAVALLVTACTALPKPPRRVTVVADGARRTVETEAESVGALLRELEITLEGLDRISVPENAALSDGMVITITRVLQYTETETETIPFGRQILRDASMPQGESRLLETGQSGLLERIYRVTEEDGRVVERTLVREAVVEPPRDEVLLVGMRPQVETVRVPGTLVYMQNRDAWVIRESNRTRRRLTSLGDLDGRVFALSDDGERLLFTRAVTGSGHFNELWLVKTAEADPLPLPLNVYDLLWASLAPDGRTLAWTTAEPTDRAPGWRGQNDLWTAQLTSQQVVVSRRRVLAPEAGGGYGWWGTRYAWSPDGRRLAYARPDEVGVVDLRRGRREPLAAFAAYRTYGSWAWTPTPAWTPDGAFIVAVLHGKPVADLHPEESPVFDLWMLEATGAYSAEIASEVGMWAAPRPSPDGETLLFGRAEIPYRSDVSAYRLCFADRDGSNARCPYPPDASAIELPVWRWGPDGQHVAFIQQGEVYLFRPDDGAVMRLTDEGNIRLLDW